MDTFDLATLPFSAWLAHVAAEADHAWALELNEMSPEIRKLTILVQTEAERRMVDSFVYGQTFTDASGRRIEPRDMGLA